MNLNLNDICRLCLRSHEKYVDLNQTNGAKPLSKELAEKIKFCYLTEIDLTQGLPTKVCYECIQVISFFYTAKRNFYSSEQLLRNVLQVRKKLQDEIHSTTEIHEEENVLESDICKTNLKKGKTGKSLLDVNNESLKTMNEVEFNNTSHHNSSNILNAECRKDTFSSVSPTEMVTTIFKQHSDNKVQNKKDFKHCPTHPDESDKLGLTLSDPSKLGVSLKLMVSKKLRIQPKRNSKLFKVYTPNKKNRTDTALEEPEFKEIGTVIDTNNILSPNVKRTRKTVL